MKIQKILYWVATALICLVMLYSVNMYLTKTEMVKGLFEKFNYPGYIVIPLAIAKLSAVVVILWNKIKWLKEWAYAGIFFDLILAITAHHYAGDGIGLSTYSLVFLFTSYFLGRKVRP